MAARKALKINLNPAQVTMLSFLALSLLGAFLLSLPISNTDGKWLDPVASIFMGVSATCVTGLAVVDVGHDFTMFGQAVILFLMQIGGLSYMTITTILVYITGKKLGISEAKIFDMSNNSEAKINFADFVIKIATLTLVVEGIGLLFLLKDSLEITALSFSDLSDPQYFITAIFQAMFHAVSAFCNAGLSLYSGSLENHASNHWMLFVFSLLPIIGGLGYTVLNELYTVFTRKGKHRSVLSLHTRVSLWITGILLVLGVLVQMVLVYIQDLPSLTNHVQIFWQSFFQTCAARSSGFNSIPLTELGDPSLVWLIVYMFIGACPGGTGGGIKVTTLILVFAMMYAGLKNKDDVNIFNRSINATYQKRAMIVFVSTVVMIILFTFMLEIFESAKHLRFIDHLFEVTSAFTTVGLSTGITGALSDPSLIVLSLCMLIGRPGPLLFLMALIPESIHREARYPEEGILIG